MKTSTFLWDVFYYILGGSYICFVGHCSRAPTIKQRRIQFESIYRLYLFNVIFSARSKRTIDSGGWLTSKGFDIVSVNMRTPFWCLSIAQHNIYSLWGRLKCPSKTYIFYNFVLAMRTRCCSVNIEIIFRSRLVMNWPSLYPNHHRPSVILFLVDVWMKNPRAGCRVCWHKLNQPQAE